MMSLQTRERERERGGQNSVTNCRCKRVSPSGKTKREQSISKENIKKERKRESSKEKGGRCFVFAAACSPLRNTRVAAEIDSYGDPKEQKTNECFTECEREREGQKRDSELVRGGGDGGPRSAFTWSGPNLPCGQAHLCSRGHGQEPPLWLSLATFTLRRNWIVPLVLLERSLYEQDLMELIW
jgi:hypothetical protein